MSEFDPHQFAEDSRRWALKSRRLAFFAFFSGALNLDVALGFFLDSWSRDSLWWMVAGVAYLAMAYWVLRCGIRSWRTHQAWHRAYLCEHRLNQCLENPLSTSSRRESEFEQVIASLEDVKRTL